MTTAQLFVTLLVIIFVAAVGWFAPDPFSLVEDAPDTIWEVFLALIFISFVLERSLRVFVITWRQPSELRLEQEIAECESKFKWLEIDTMMAQEEKNNQFKQAIERKAEIVLQLQRHRFQTHRISLWIALAAGICVSAIGFRALAPIVNATSVPIPYQEAWLRICDIFLTGGLIAGGSEGIRASFDAMSAFLKSPPTR